MSASGREVFRDCATDFRCKQCGVNGLEPEQQLCAARIVDTTLWEAGNSVAPGAQQSHIERIVQYTANRQGFPADSVETRAALASIMNIATGGCDRIPADPSQR